MKDLDIEATCNICYGYTHDTMNCNLVDQIAWGHLTSGPCSGQASNASLTSSTINGNVHGCYYCGSDEHAREHCPSKQFIHETPSPPPSATTASVTKTGSIFGLGGRASGAQTDSPKRVRSDSTSMPPPELVSKRPRVDNFSSMTANMFAPKRPHVPSSDELVQEFESIKHEVQKTQEQEADIEERIRTLEAARTINKLNQLRLMREGMGIRDKLIQTKETLMDIELTKKKDGVVAACKEWVKLK